MFHRRAAWLRQLTAVALGLLLAVALVIGSVTALADEGDPTTLADLVAVYDVGTVPADVLVVIDTSASMIQDGNPPPWPGVVRGYKALVNAVGPADRLGLITFDSTAAIRLDPEALRTDQDRATAIKQLPKRPRGQFTDIGTALEAAVSRLSRAGAAEIQTLVFITDGRHDPPPNSKYPSKSSPSWKPLERRGRALDRSRRSRLNVFGWGTGAASSTDVGLVRRVFPNAQIMALPPRQVPQFLESLATEVQRERVRPSAQSDLRAQIQSTLAVPDELTADMEADLNLTNPRVGLPTNVSLRGLTVTEADGSSVDATVTPQQVRLAPGESAQISVTLHPRNTDHGRLTIGEQTDSRDWTATVDADTALSAQLTSLLVTEHLATEKQTVGRVSQPGVVDASTRYGLSWTRFLITTAALALLIMAAVWALRWAFIPPTLAGHIEDDAGNRLLRLSGKEAELPNASVVAPDTADRVRLFTKPRGLGKRVWIQRTGGDPRVGGRPLTRRPQRLFSPDRIDLGGRKVVFQSDKGGKSDEN